MTLSTYTVVREPSPTLLDTRRIVKRASASVSDSGSALASGQAVNDGQDGTDPLDEMAEAEIFVGRVLIVIVIG